MVTLVVGSWMVVSVDGTVSTRSTLNMSADSISITRTTIITTTCIITVLVLMLLILLGAPPAQLSCYDCYYRLYYRLVLLTTTTVITLNTTTTTATTTYYCYNGYLCLQLLLPLPSLLHNVVACTYVHRCVHMSVYSDVCL